MARVLRISDLLSNSARGLFGSVATEERYVYVYQWVFTAWVTMHPTTKSSLWGRLGEDVVTIEAKAQPEKSVVV
jgi:hypothetical protein